MTERKWTKEQEDAMNTQGKTLLLSAAAGSGKTATLTERIIRSLLSETEPSDISRMAIMTFTRAASAELRERIYTALTDAIASHPENRRLAGQLLLLPSAKICTIDSFCADLLRTHASKAGLSQSFRVCDENERTLLMQEVMEGLIGECYEANESNVLSLAEFCRLAEEFSSPKKESTLTEQFLSLYSRTESFVEGCGILKKHKENFTCGAEFFATPFGQTIREDTRTLFSHYQRIYEELLTELRRESIDIVMQNHYPSYAQDLRYMEHVLPSLSSYRSAKDAITSYEKLKRKNVPKNTSDADDRLGYFQGEFREKQKVLYEKYYLYTEEELKILMEQHAELHELLYRFLSEFERRFSGEKRRRNLCDYGDLEHLAHALLVQEDGTPSETALAIRENYDHIYIDEYQDINPVQHSIFSAITREDNCFMVGDIKQSIYSFRRADPDIFAQMKKSFPRLAQGEESKNASIFMSKNFRCDDTIISFTNTVFDHVFGIAGDTIGYCKEDALLHGKAEAEQKHLPMILLCERRQNEAKEDTYWYESDDEGDEEEKRDPAASIEALAIAKEILRLTSKETKNDGTPIQAKDIAILLRADKAKAPLYAQALSLYGIPASAADTEDFFTRPHILFMLSLLHTINNPQRDIYLAGVLHSPLYGFSMEDLIEIRRAAPKELSLYHALKQYTESKEEFTKGRAFLEDLSRFRQKALHCPADKLIDFLYKETGILQSAEATSSVHDQLHLFYQYARSFEASSYKGLYHFIAYVTEVAQKTKQQAGQIKTESDNCVKIMSIHRSKGLEFPVCFIADCGRALLPQEIKQDPIFYGPQGVSLRFLTPSGDFRAENPIRQAMISRIRQANAEEEMRILYVALTRARERLYLSGKLRKGTENFFTDCEIASRYADTYSILGASSYWNWILPALWDQKDRYQLRYCTDTGELSEVSVLSEEANDFGADSNALEQAVGSMPKKTEAPSADPPLSDAQKEALLQRFSFVYPDAHLNVLPAKLSVSRLYPDMLRLTEAETAIWHETEEGSSFFDEETKDLGEKAAEEAPRLPIPEFLQGHRVSAAERGTSTHLFMQFADFRLLAAHGTDAEIERLLSLGFLRKEDAEQIFRSEIRAFAASDLMQLLLQASDLRRELRFNLFFPASDFAAQEEDKRLLADERLLVQGVIDCIAEEADGSYHIIDYKTDRLSEEERKDPRLAEEKLIRRHGTQLFYYAKACEKMYKRPPKSVLLYSLPLGRCISVPISEEG